jgi:nucleotide-binding universal stress UspA family protein
MNVKTSDGRASRQVASQRKRRQHIVVGVQGDDASVAALRWSARCARARGAELEALMAWELPEPPRHLPGGLRQMTEGVVGDLRWALEAIVDRSGICAAPGISVTTTVATAPVKLALANAAERADLLVLGSVQHSVALAALSVSRQTAASASCPVVLVPVGPLDAPAETGGDRLVVGMDGSPQSAAAFAWACDEAAFRKLPLKVVGVSLTKGALDAVAAMVAAALRAHPALAIELVTHAGDPGEVLAAASLGAEALVVGQHGSGSIRRRLPALGSVSRWCAAHTVSPVVVVPARWIR